MTVLQLEPERVWYYFDELSKVPRGSGNREFVGKFCIGKAQELGLDWEQDEIGNVLIRKPATKGYEDMPGVILQGHMDMVCVKTKDKDIDFENDGITLCTDGEKVWADGTTLGADDGIAIAYAFAILEATDIAHPALEVLLTVDEEIGLLGATDFDVTKLKGERLINIDSEEEGILTVSCAGGARAICRLPIEREEAKGEKVKISISHLQGGHSGMEIKNNRTNAIVLLGRLLNYIQTKCDIRIVELKGGGKENAIASDAAAVIRVFDRTKAENVFLEYKAILQRELNNTEPMMEISFDIAEAKRGEEARKIEEIAKKGEEKEEMLSEKATKAAVFMLYHIPNGIQKMNPDMEGLVQTSLNIGILNTEKEWIETWHSLRSSVASEKEELKERLDSFMHMLGGSAQFLAEYPAWEYEKESKLREICVEVYEKVYGEKPEVVAIHAGLECGIFAAKKEHLDCISFGPDLCDVHTVKECASVQSVARVWNYVLEILKYHD